MDASTSLVDEYARLPLCARALVPYALVIGFVLNPLFSLDDFVAFCPGDILRRAQFHRVFTSLLYIEGAFSALAIAWAAFRVVAPWERSRGTLRTVRTPSPRRFSPTPRRRASRRSRTHSRPRCLK